MTNSDRAAELNGATGVPGTRPGTGGPNGCPATGLHVKSELDRIPLSKTITRPVTGAHVALNEGVAAGDVGTASLSKVATFSRNRVSVHTLEPGSTSLARRVKSSALHLTAPCPWLEYSLLDPVFRYHQDRVSSRDGHPGLQLQPGTGPPADTICLLGRVRSPDGSPGI